ncbi:hypothetical protein Taro_049294, partial [Colocasia esculenta]|nr:hypothetical protein [Colocasia esculenta]
VPPSRLRRLSRGQIRLPDYNGCPDDRKSLWEARNKATKIAGSQDLMAWVDYSPRHELKSVPTFCELFDRTHKRKWTDDNVSESARMIVRLNKCAINNIFVLRETYDRTMTDCYAEGTPQPDLDAEAWVDAAGRPSCYKFGIFKVNFVGQSASTLADAD